MDLSSFWSQLLLNVSTVCVPPEPSILIEGVQIITPSITSSETNSSQSSENSTPSPETEKEVEEDNEEVIEEASSNDNLNNEDEEGQKKNAVQRIRYSKEEYRCTQCPYTCTTEKAFFRHVRNCEIEDANDSKRLLSCPICGKDRQCEQTLNIHMTKHKQDKYFCCDICKFKTLQLKKLIQHRRMHTGEKPHLCPFCTYRSARRDNLRSHARRVHKKQDLPCDTFNPRSMVLSPRRPK